MKPTYKGFEAKENKMNFITLPPVGAYIAKIMGVRVVDADGKRDHDTIELMMEITEGEYAGRFNDVYNDQKNRFGNATYKGIFRLTLPKDGDEDWITRNFEGNLWCVEQSNPGYAWDWDENKLKGKTVGISIRKRLYTYDGKDRETVEIGKFETVKDVKDGKVRPMRDRDQRTPADNNPVTDEESSYMKVNTDELPW